MNDNKSKKAHTHEERLKLQSAFTRYLQNTQQRTSHDTAKAFAVIVVSGNSEEFRGMSEEEIYNVLTGRG